MCCNAFRKKIIFSKPLDASAPKAQRSIISSYATSPTGLDTKLSVPQNSQHNTTQHNTTQHNTCYNFARNNFSGYAHSKSNSKTAERLPYFHSGKRPVKKSMTLSVKGYALQAFQI